MRKLMTFCFTVLLTVLSALSCFNFAFEALDQIEGDKSMLTIGKPAEMPNDRFLASIDDALAEIHADIMFRYVDNTGEKAHYQYYKTSHTADFLESLANADAAVLQSGECLSTTMPDGYAIQPLRVSSLMQDISVFPWSDAGPFDLSMATYYVKAGQQSIVADAIGQLGYTVAVSSTNYISGQFSVLLFGFVPSFMLVASMAFYILSNGKRNVLKKMEGYVTGNILANEAKETFPVLAISLLAVGFFSLVVAAFLYQDSLLQYALFSLPNIAICLAVLAVGTVLSGLLIHRQSSAEYVKGRVPRRGIYAITILAKVVFVSFIVFFLSIAIRNVGISYNATQTANFLSEKMDGYVTIPVSMSNASSQTLAENYKKFYSATVNRYNGILIDASNYEYDLISGKTPAEEFGQTSIVVNRNFLDFNPIYDCEGNQIAPAQLSDDAFNVILPKSQEQNTAYWRELVHTAYSMEANFILYDESASEIYSYNANTGTGNLGKIDGPVILVVEEEQLEGIFVLSYCSQGSYFLKVDSADPYHALLPILRETGIAATTPDTPTISSTFSAAINHQRQMLLLYGTQSAILLAGLFCLVLFSARLYCENYKSKIAICLIEGYSPLSCLKKHLFATALYYIAVVIALRFMAIIMQVSLNYMLLPTALFAEIGIALIIGRKYAHKNLYQIVKGAG